MYLVLICDFYISSLCQSLAHSDLSVGFVFSKIPQLKKTIKNK